MDFSNLLSAIALITQGGPSAILAILVFIIAALLLDWRRLVAELTRKDEKIERIVDVRGGGRDSVRSDTFQKLGFLKRPITRK